MVMNLVVLFGTKLINCRAMGAFWTELKPLLHDRMLWHSVMIFLFLSTRMPGTIQRQWPHHSLFFEFRFPVIDAVYLTMQVCGRIKWLHWNLCPATTWSWPYSRLFNPTTCTVSNHLSLTMSLLHVSASAKSSSRWIYQHTYVYKYRKFCHRILCRSEVKCYH
jgi:hypothetical protein